MLKKYGIHIVEQNIKDTDSEVERMFEGLSDSKEDSLDAYVEKYTAPIQEKVQKIRIFSPRKKRFVSSKSSAQSHR